MTRVKIRIKFFAIAASEIGTKEIEVFIFKDLNIALNQIEEIIKWPLRSNIEDNRFALMINGTLKLPIENKQLADGDVLALIPIMGGG